MIKKCDFLKEIWYDYAVLLYYILERRILILYTCSLGITDQKENFVNIGKCLFLAYDC